MHANYYNLWSLNPLIKKDFLKAHLNFMMGTLLDTVALTAHAYCDMVYVSMMFFLIVFSIITGRQIAVGYMIWK